METTCEEDVTASCVRYHVCIRCNKRHTHKRFQDKKPHTDVPLDWQQVLGYYVNKHTGRPLMPKILKAGQSPVMCHSCHKQYVNRLKRRPSPSFLEPVVTPEPKRRCPTRSETSFEHAVDLILLLSSSVQSPTLPSSTAAKESPANDTIKECSLRAL